MKYSLLLLVVVLAVASTVSAQRSSRGRVIFRSSSRSRPSSSRSFRPSTRVVTSSRPSSSSSGRAVTFSAPAPAPAPAPRPAPSTLSFSPIPSTGALSFAPPASGLAGLGLGGLVAPVRSNPRSQCPSCIGPGIDSFFAEPVNPIELQCYQNLAARLPGSRVHVGLDEVLLLDQNNFPREAVFDSFGRNLFELCSDL